MQDLAPTAQQAAQPPQAPQKEKKQRISKRMSEGIRLLVTGECITHKAASERAGMNYTHFCEQLKKPHVRVFYERSARESIASGVMRAAARINCLVDASSEHVSFDAAKHVLGIAGIKPASDAQVSVNIDIKAGYVLDLRSEAFSDKLTRNNEINDLQAVHVNDPLTPLPGDEPRHSPPAGRPSETGHSETGGKNR